MNQKDMTEERIRSTREKEIASDTKSTCKGKTPSFKRDYYDIIVVGSGLSGSVIAERYATQLNKSVLLLEKRDHIGGNCYDYIDPKTNIRVNKYGAHLFHTKSQRVYDYIHLFSDWYNYEHKVLGYVDGHFVPIPVNIDTVNTLFNTNITNENEMNHWLSSQKDDMITPTNSEEMAISRVGHDLYHKIFYPYTLKQWNIHPKHLGPEVTGRIPIRKSDQNAYFDDKYQCLPTHGYTHFFENMLNHDNIEVHLNTDYFDVTLPKYGKFYFTGPIDNYYSSLGLPKLQYRSLKFEQKILYDKKYYQPNSVVNYPSLEYKHTRIVEYKHFSNNNSQHTILFYEYPMDCDDDAEPFYPIPNDRNYDLYEKYKEYANKEESIKFVGRLANYRYFNMDQAILNALELFDRDTKDDNGGVEDSKKS